MTPSQPPAQAETGVRPAGAHVGSLSGCPATRIATLLLVPLVLVGLWISLHYTYANWWTSPDNIVSVTFWRQIGPHGLPAAGQWRAALGHWWHGLEHWGYTTDNWLLSLIAVDSLLYALFGATPLLVIGTGWLIFLGGCAISFLIARRVCGTLPAALVGTVLLFANRSASGTVGYLTCPVSHNTCPVSHNTSALWELAAVLFALRWSATARWR